MNYSKAFVRFNWITLVLIYLVVVAGSFVRITGSGMGCPDWPKCFGQWVPPTSADQLPSDYKEKYTEGREKKVIKFSKLLSALGMGDTAEKLQNDPDLLKEEDFNVRRTWTEYVNRLFGFLAGNAMLLAFFWLLLIPKSIGNRKRKLVLLAALNLVLMGIEAWFGSIVVATNLVPWTITVHMLLALVIIGLQIYLIRCISPAMKGNLKLPKWTLYLLWVCFGITIYQLFLGTQVRESIDELTKLGYGRESWTEQLGVPYYIHRSFSWLVLVLLTIMAWKNERGEKLLAIRAIYIVLGFGLISGVLLAYANMPGLVQTSHLIFATILFGIMTMSVIRGKSATQVT
ncbi:MAG: COX15/CtaA family protein [Crocinitomicaceae bacterium]|nr:COX15/CtaA family protein [Flavobacteriales bacterium]NQZ37663.1 COX15/CtaA family protein [Crocinitomicaceae bacterium]